MSQINCVKAKLSSGKEVLLREIKIKHQEYAAMAAAPRANGDSIMLGIYMQKELLKQLIMQIDGQPVKPIQLEDLDSLFSFQEWAQLNQVLGKLAGGGDDLGKFQIEVVSSGGN